MLIGALRSPPETSIPIHDSVMAMVERDRPSAVVIDMSSVIMMDMDGDRILARLATEMRRKIIRFLLARVGTRNLELLRKTGTLDLVGPEDVYVALGAAVAAAQGGGDS